MADLRITEDTSGSPRGIHTREFSAGEVVGMDDPRMSQQLAEVLVDDGTAEWVEERSTKPVGPDETKPDGPEETKVDSFESSGGWKTFYDEEGWELGKEQVSKEEAEQAVEQGLTFAEIQDDG